MLVASNRRGDPFKIMRMPRTHDLIWLRGFDLVERARDPQALCDCGEACVNRCTRPELYAQGIILDEPQNGKVMRWLILPRVDEPWRLKWINQS